MRLEPRITDKRIENRWHDEAGDDVSAAVGVKLSKSATDRIVVATQGHMLDGPTGTVALSPVVIGIVVVVVMLVPTVAGQQLEKIRDRSVLQKF